MPLLIVILLMSFGTLSGLSGQDREFHSEIRRLPSGVALSQTRVSQIVQDDTGFLWFGTQFGLNRYDGVRIKEFLYDPQDPRSIACSYVQHLFKDRHGRLWVGCGESFDLYNPETEDFTHFHVSGAVNADRSVVSVLDDGRDRLMLATSSGVFQFNPLTGASQQLSLHWPKHTSESDEPILSIDVDNKGRLWLLTRSALNLVDSSTGNISKSISIPKTYQYGSFHQDRHGAFWLIAAYHLFRVDPDRGTIEYAAQIAGSKGPPSFHSMMEDADGGMWFGTENTGVIHVLPDGRSIERFSRQLGIASSLPADHVTALSQDRFGDIWLGFHDTAPAVIQRDPTSSETITFQPWALTGLKSPLVTVLFELKPDSLLIGTGKATQVLDRVRHQYSEPFPFLKGLDVFDVLRDRQQRLWFATERGLYRYESVTHTPKRMLDDGNAYRLLEDHMGTIWVLLRDRVMSYDESSGTFTDHLVADPGESFYALAQAPDGRLWIGGSRGLQKIDPITGLQRFPFVGNESGPSDPRINALHFDAKGRLWVGTQSGLNLYLPEQGKFERVSVPGSLGGQITSCILEDRSQKLWLSSNQGLLRFDPDTREFELYNGAFGGSALDLSGWGACAKGSSGNLFFGGFSGAVTFSPETIGLPMVSPRVTLTGLVIGTQSVAISSGGPLKQSLVLARRIDLDHTQNDLAFEFSTLDFRQADTQRLRYQLQGAGNEWVAIPPDQHTLSFVHLKPRTYTLRMQSVSLDGTIHDAGVHLTIVVAKPWWATTKMYCIYGLCLCVLIGLAYRHRMKRLSDIYDARMEGRVRERTALARQLHDTLLQDFQGLILRFVGITTQVDKALAPVLDAAITQAQLSLIEGRDAIQEMRTEPIRMDDLPAALEEMAKDLDFLSTATVTIRADEKAIGSCTHDAREIFSIAKEALRNALQHADATQIDVRFERTVDQFVLSISDDGHGISESFGDQEFGDSDRGLHRMLEKATRLGGELSYESAPGKGTALRLGLPRKRWAETPAQYWKAVVERLSRRSPRR